MRIKNFYDKLFLLDEYAPSCYVDSEKVGLFNFLKRFSLQNASVLDIGCGRGWYQNLVSNWLGIDISIEAGKMSNGRFICGLAESLPLKSKCIDIIWSITFLEHSPDPEKVLKEMNRVLIDGGFLYLAPAWRVPPWRPKGLEVKKFNELGLFEKLYKVLLPFANFFWMRGFFWVPIRFIREVEWKLRRRVKLRFVSFKPNLEQFLLPDSDAQSSIDNHEVLLWFLSNGFRLPEPMNWLQRIFMRCGPVIVIKQTRFEK